MKGDLKDEVLELKGASETLINQSETTQSLKRARRSGLRYVGVVMFMALFMLISAGDLLRDGVDSASIPYFVVAFWALLGPSR